MVQKIHPRGVIWVPRIRPGFDDSNLASALSVRSIYFSSPWSIGTNAKLIVGSLFINVFTEYIDFEIYENLVQMCAQSH